MSAEKISGIYTIKCLTNGKVYIGSSVKIKQRWQLHLGRLRRNKHENQVLQNTWNKYGADTFEWNILEHISIDGLSTEDIKQLLILREQHHIDIFSNTVLFNICPVAGSCLGVKFSEERCANVSRYRTGVKSSAEARANISEAKKHQSPETRAKIGDGNRRRVITDEMRANMSKASLSQTAETRVKISESLRGKIPHNKGKSISEEQKIKISHTLRNRQPLELDGVIRTLKEWAELCGISVVAMRRRLKKWNLRIALTTIYTKDVYM